MEEVEVRLCIEKCGNEPPPHSNVCTECLERILKDTEAYDC